MWKQLTVSDLKKILSDDEVNTLLATSTTSEDVAQDVLDLVSDMFRGALRQHGFAYDTRDHYTPSSYHLRILECAREVIWTRFPNSNTVAIDELRKEAAKRLDDLLKNIYISPDLPEDEYSSAYQSALSGTIAGSLVLPYLRYNEGAIYFKSVLSAF